MKIYFLLFIISFHAYCGPEVSKNPGASMSWFPSEQFVRLEVEQFPNLDSKKPATQFKTEDAGAIAQLVARITRLPSQGDKMKSPSNDTVKTSLHFFPEGKKESTLIESTVEPSRLHPRALT